jgi:hypothetical protein
MSEDVLSTPKYTISCFGDSPIEPVQVFTTYGNWDLVDRFLITYDASGLKEAYLLKPSVEYIRTWPVAPEPKGIADDYAESAE